MAENIQIGTWVNCKSGDQVTEEESLIHALLLMLCSLCKTARSSYTRYLTYLCHSLCKECVILYAIVRHRNINNIFVIGTACMFSLPVLAQTSNRISTEVPQLLCYSLPGMHHTNK